mgnify:CR=1 FL=1
MKYGIQATITKESIGFGVDGKVSTTKQVPFFYLDGEVQGIQNIDHACKIAKSILNPFDDKDLIVVVFANVMEDK